MKAQQSRYQSRNNVRELEMTSLTELMGDDDGAYIKKTLGTSRPELFVVEEEKDGRVMLSRCKIKSSFDPTFTARGRMAKRLKVGHVVEADTQDKGFAEVTRLVGHISDKDMLNYISLLEAGINVEYSKENGLRAAFSQAALREANQARIPDFSELEGYEDLRSLPLVTIDPEMSKDYDDAVFAYPREEGGFHMITAIAGVWHFVKLGSALDIEAAQRCNTIYLPGKDILMLPERLSYDICSLQPNQDRICMAYHIDVDADGNIVNGYARKAMMRSAARLTYAAAQDVFDGNGKAGMKYAHLQEHIANLYAASDAVEKAKIARDVLTINKGEFEIKFDAQGEPSDIGLYQMYKSNKVVENFALVANNWVGETMAREGEGIYRVHPRPKSLDRLLKAFAAHGVNLKDLDVSDIDENKITPKIYNEILAQVKSIEGGNADIDELKGEMIRATERARYSAEKGQGHFGLQMENYTHSTSPIRRYPDIVATRIMLGEQAGDVKHTANLCSDTEKSTSEISRSVMQRFNAAVYQKRANDNIEAEVKYVNCSGLIVKLEDKGVEASIPLKFVNSCAEVMFDEKSKAMVDADSKEPIYAKGTKLKVRIAKVNPANGRIVCRLVVEKPSEAPLARNKNNIGL